MKPAQRLILGLPVIASAFQAPFVAAQQNSTFDWESLKGSDNVTWVPCYGANYQCARFNVPLNYSDPSAGTGTIAMVQIPANVPKDSPDYKGPVFFNPGGPGSGGVDFLLSPFGPVLSTLTGAGFDIVSFDPRGVGRSTPPANFYTSDAERLSWNLSTDPSEDITISPYAIGRMMAKSKILGALAKERDNGILMHLTTDNVARDMKAMSESLGQDKLQYYGVSYGTALGATYAAMFPDKVERIVLDGVLDTTSYYTSSWLNQLVDTDKALQAFFDGCASAGPERCAFHESTSDAVSKRFYKLLDSVTTHPVAAYSNDTKSQLYGIVDNVIVSNTMFEGFYAPYSYYAPLAQGLANLEKGDGLLMWILGIGASLNSNAPSHPDSAAQCDASNIAQYENIDMAVFAIRCTDVDPVSEDVDEMMKYYEDNKNASSTAATWVGVRARCAGWQAHPDHFTGPIEGNTSFPMIFIGNTKDPVTPLSRAKAMSSRFPGSVVLTYDAIGHSSLTAISSCVTAHTAQYFTNGTLPAEGTVCPLAPGTELFPSDSSSGSSNSSSVITKRSVDVESIQRVKWFRRPV